MSICAKNKFVTVPGRLALAVIAAAAVLQPWSASALQLRAVEELDEAPLQDDDNASTYARADRMSGNPHEVLHLVGNAEIRRGGAALRGDRITYTQETDEVRARGNVRVASQGAVFTGEEADYRVDARTGTMPDAEYTLGPRGLRGCADLVEFLDGTIFQMTKARVTSCGKDDNSWWIDMDRLDIDQEDQTATGDWASLNIGGVPVFTAPWFTFPVGSERRSGLLIPNVGMSSSKGFELAVPYYFNLAPNYDYTLTPYYLSKRGLMLMNEFRYLEPRFSGLVKYDYLHDDNEYGDDRYALHISHRYANGGFYAGVNYNRVSDNDYISDFSGSIRESSENILNQDFWMGYGQDFWNASLRVAKNQAVRSASGYGRPYERVPKFSFNTYKGDLGGFEYIGVVEATRFKHQNSRRPDGDRFVIDQGVSYPMRGPYWFVEPKARWISTWYSMDSAKATLGSVELDQHSSRHLPILSIDSGLIFDRKSSWLGRAAEQTLEPRLLYAYIPYRDQSRMPVFDTTLSDINLTQLFEESVFSGYDRISEANQLTTALTTRYLDSESGIELFRGTIGQRFYFKDQRVGLYDIYTGKMMGERTDTNSDFLGSFGARLSKSVTTDGTVTYSSDSHRVTKAYGGVTWQPRRSSVMSLYYRYNYAPNDNLNNIKQIDFGVQWPVTDKLYVIGRYNYSYNIKKPIEVIAGFEYYAGCWTVRTALQRYRSSDDENNTTFFFQLELKGLGSAGADPLKELREGIPGYQSMSPVQTVTGRYEYYE